LTKDMEMPKSVHLSDWPSGSKPDTASTKVLDEMKWSREIIAEGLAQRAEVKVKVRQPLAAVKISGLIDDHKAYEEIIAEELNVKKVIWSSGKTRVKVNTKLTDELKAEGLMRELVRHIQNARKNAGLNVEDRIKLKIETNSKDVKEAVDKFKDTIFTETLTTEKLKGDGQYSETVKVEGQEVIIRLSRAG